MSWASELFSPILRFFGIGRPKDIAIPPPLPGSDLIHLMQDPGSPTPTVLREREAIEAIRGFVRSPYQIVDRRIYVLALLWEDARKSFASRGNDPKNWPKSRIGMFYAPKPSDPFPHGTIHLVMRDLPQPERVRLALHEYGHGFWHWILTVSEWHEWQMRNWTYEEFADDFARRMLGEKLDMAKTRFFLALETRLREQGTKAQRL